MMDTQVDITGQSCLDPGTGEVPSMDIDGDYFKAILQDLIEENPLACHGILSVAGVEFTGTVPTLAVTLNEERPRLLVNLEFIRFNCEGETEVKSLLLHEFLHVLLNHTGEYRSCDTATNLALDAVINHIIHRSCGPSYSEFFSRYYQYAEGWMSLLAPDSTNLSPDTEFNTNQELIEEMRQGLRFGTVLADDILDLARDAQSGGSFPGQLPVFIGNHDPKARPGKAERAVSGTIEKALDATFRELNGSDMFRDPVSRGCGAEPRDDRWSELQEKRADWERATLRLLRKIVTPDPRSRRMEMEYRPALLPVLNGADRRGFMRSLWSPLIPDIRWELPHLRHGATTVVYLDVSGSMNQEMASLVRLLNSLRKWIRLPLWAFSNEVVPATIEDGVLKTSTTGGTAMNCVLRHIAETCPENALVITDGYIEKCDQALLGAARDTSIHALIARHGDPARLEGEGIPTTQLAEHPAQTD